MLFDTHMHTTFSTDSRMTIEEAQARAKELHLGIIVTEHMDLAYPEPEAFTFDVDDYFAAYGPRRSDSLLLGIEIGMREDCVDANRKIIADADFDFVIGSIHVVENIDIYQESFYLTREKEEVYLAFPTRIAVVEDTRGIMINNVRIFSEPKFLIADRYGVHLVDSNGIYLDTFFSNNEQYRGSISALAAQGYGDEMIMYMAERRQGTVETFKASPLQ